MQNKSQNKLLKLCSLALLSGSLAFTSTAFAKKAEQKEVPQENIDVTNQQVTKDELAAIYVLTDICPSLIKQDKQFDAGLQRLLKDYLPTEKNPEKSLKSLVKQSSFKQALDQAQQDAKKAGNKANTEVCEDIKNY
jgi:spore coat protein CotF